VVRTPGRHPVLGYEEWWIHTSVVLLRHHKHYEEQDQGSKFTKLNHVVGVYLSCVGER
jgi:hypothetical protein